MATSADSGMTAGSNTVTKQYSWIKEGHKNFSINIVKRIRVYCWSLRVSDFTKTSTDKDCRKRVL